MHSTLVINKMKLPCRRKWKAFVCLLVACCLVIGITQMIDRGQYCEYKTNQSLAMGLDKYNANGGSGESPSLSGVIYPEVTTVPKVVYYLWCDNATFEFRHYLSVLSVVRFLRPDKIIMEYGPTPLVDRYEYNTWLAELKGDVSYLLVDQMQDRKHARVCRDEKSMRAHILSVIRTEGGIYVGKRTIFARELRRALNENLTNQLLSSSEGFIASKGGVVIEGEAWPSKQDTCLKSSEFSSRKYNASDETTHVCAYSAIYPRDIMHGDDAFSSLARLLFYGDRAVPEPRPGVELIPNIAHMLWIGGQTIDFLFYLSALSLLHVVNVERLFVHGNGPPSGPYWQRLADHTRVTYVPCAKPNVAFGHRTGSKHHMSDIFRAPVMIKYGGIYSDVDVIWTRAPSLAMRSYEAVASFDWANSYKPYPNYINLGVSMGQRGSRFWRLFRDSMKNFRDDIFGFNGLLQPYKVYERHPDTIRMDDHLQVMCFRDRCYPRWGVTFEAIDWRNDTHAIHWTYPNPPEFANMSTLLKASGTWADIGRNVLQHAGLLDAQTGR